MKNKLLCLLLCLTLLVSLTGPVRAEEETASGETETAPTGEAPAEEIPMTELRIYTTEDFLEFAENCRLDSYSRNLRVLLERDIDLEGVAFSGVPIFCGILEGNGHRITGVDIRVEGSAQGLFRYLTAEAEIRDLTVSGSVTPAGSRNTVGGIAGRNDGVLRNCAFDGTVSGGDKVGGLAGINGVTAIIENCQVSGEVHGSHFVGGIAGENAGVIRMCGNSAQVNTTALQNTVDISDITMDTLTDSESANTVTDIGGIAGISSGVIRGCENRGDVGYQHMGYNIGGIAGSQTGYVVDCVNDASIQGRKEVGGIVGQMEPVSAITYTEDTLQILQGQLDTMSGLVDQASGNAQYSAYRISSQLDRLQNQADTAQDAVDSLIPDPEDPELPDEDSVLAAQNTLSATLTQMPQTMSNIAAATESAAYGMGRDLQNISGQITEINSTLSNASENLGMTVTDVSDLDTEELLTAKAERCVNLGSVLADLNVGGIAGAMAMETDLDFSEDLEEYGESSLNIQSEVRTVILNCENKGAVTGKKQNVGGITGWQSLGLVKACANTGAVEGADADYVGGITGWSAGYIRNCDAKCRILGARYVGGIAGSAGVATDCRSMVVLSGSENLGAVLGRMEAAQSDRQNSVSNNLYVCIGDDPGAIDGISYDTMAQPMAFDAFFAQEDLPELFRSVTVSFVLEDGSRRTVTLTPGESLAMEDVPPVPEKPGYEGHWNGLTQAALENITFDKEFTVSYICHDTAIQSAEQRGSRPLMLLQGDFLPGAEMSVASLDQKPSLAEDQIFLEAWQFSASGADHVTAARFLYAAETHTDRLQVFVLSSAGVWREVAYSIDGSYVVFAVECGDLGFALAETVPEEIPWHLVGAGCAAVLLLAAVGFFIGRNKKKKQASQAQPDGT